MRIRRKGRERSGEEGPEREEQREEVKIGKK
jgi:hypothetical protein